MLTLIWRRCWTKRLSRPVPHREIAIPSNDVDRAPERWGGRPVLGGSTSPGQLLDAAATGDVGADRRLRRRAAVSNSPQGRRNQIQNTTNSPPTRGIFRDIRETVGRSEGLRRQIAQVQ